MQKGHGLILDEIVPGDHYILGGYKSIGGKPLKADRDWRSFVPAHQETQNRGFETFSCTNFGTANALEILIKFLFNEDVDFSDRWFAKESGTSVIAQGNSPHKVAEFARTLGLVKEDKWAFDSTIDTVEKFYATAPVSLYNTASEFVGDFILKHEWVPSNAQALYDALQQSPLGFSVCAWYKDTDGFYFRPQGFTDQHWTVLIYAEWEKYWLVLDSYKDGDVLFKKIRWDALPMQAKRYSLVRQPHVFYKNLYFPMIDKEVSCLQKALVSLGYSIPHATTDVYGTETKSAVYAFQQANGIVGNFGQNFGPRTRLQLNLAMNPDKPFGGDFWTFIGSLFSGS